MLEHMIDSQSCKRQGKLRPPKSECQTRDNCLPVLQRSNPGSERGSHLPWAAQESRAFSLVGVKMQRVGGGVVGGCLSPHPQPIPQFQHLVRVPPPWLRASLWPRFWGKSTAGVWVPVLPPRVWPGAREVVFAQGGA